MQAGGHAPHTGLRGARLNVQASRLRGPPQSRLSSISLTRPSTIVTTVT